MITSLEEEMDEKQDEPKPGDASPEARHLPNSGKQSPVLKPKEVEKPDESRNIEFKDKDGKEQSSIEP